MLKKIKKGFTLVELMVVIVIIGVIAVIAVPSYYNSIRQAKYEESVSEIVSLIKDARNTSIVGKFTGDASSHTTPKGGYGVYLQKTSTGGVLISFQDKNENKKYDNDVEDTVISSYKLPTSITIKSMSGSKATGYTATPETNLDFLEASILFQPPQGETFLNENIATKDLLDLTIVLERYDVGKSKRLKLNKISGFIETE